MPSNSDSTSTTTVGGIATRSTATTDELLDIRSRVAEGLREPAALPGCRTPPHPGKAPLWAPNVRNIIERSPYLHTGDRRHPPTAAQPDHRPAHAAAGRHGRGLWHLHAGPWWPCGILEQRRR